MCSMGIYYGLNWCAQWVSILNAAGDIIVCSTGHYWGAQWGSIMCSMEKYYVLNGKVLCAQLDIIGVLKKLGAQWEVRCSMGSYVLNGILLCAQLDIVEVLNGMLGAQREIIMYSTGHYWSAQREFIICST